MRKRQSPMEYFLFRISKTEDCWNWIGAIDKILGYGTCTSTRSGGKAHRLSWEVHNGKIPDGLFVLHSCDNRRCVNPEHLWLGTQKENQQDAINKNRSSRGERNGMSILKAVDVRRIRSEYSGQRGELTKFAKQYGVTMQAIYLAVHRKNWAWLT